MTFMSAPYIPGLTKPSGKDTIFLTLSGHRSSNPVRFLRDSADHGRAGRRFFGRGQPTIYSPATGRQFVAHGNPNIANGTPNVIPAGLISPQATALLDYFPAAQPDRRQCDRQLITIC